MVNYFFNIKLFFSCKYLRNLNVYLGIIIVGLFGFVQMMALQPTYLLHFGPFGNLLHQIAMTYPLKTRIFYRYCMYIHISEAIVAFVLAGFVHNLNFKTTMKWTISTFVNGVIGLRFLIWPRDLSKVE